MVRKSNIIELLGKLSLDAAVEDSEYTTRRDVEELEKLVREAKQDYPDAKGRTRKGLRCMRVAQDICRKNLASRVKNEQVYYL